MNLIAAVDKNWGIGRNNQLLVRIPDDMKRFRKITTGKVVVMGRKTLESFPGGEPLKNRINLVLTTDRSYQEKYKGKEVTFLSNMEELAKELQKYNTEDIFVIGGESVYRQLLEQCDTAYITKIGFEYQADAWFPVLEERDGWKLTEESGEQTYLDLEYYYLKYERLA